MKLTAEMAEALVKRLIQSQRVVVFAKSYCPFCIRTNNLLRSKNIDFEYYELDKKHEEEDVQAAQDALLKLTGQRSVPNIFITGKSIGGNDKAQTLEASGELDKLLLISH